MVFRNENFALGNWFNNHEEIFNDTEVNSNKYDESPIEIVSLVEEKQDKDNSCFVCHATNVSLMKSTIGGKSTAVYVCSKKCEKKHLQKTKKRGSSKSSSSDLIAEDDTVCFVCQAPDPEFLSTKNTTKDAPSVPVCSLTCEEEYLDNRGLHLTKKSKPNSTKKSSKKYEEDDDDDDFEIYDPHHSQSRKKPTKQNDRFLDEKEEEPEEEEEEEEGVNTITKKKYRESLKLLRDTLVQDSVEEEGYTSWWAGALAFYDYVYQRHGMWHMYAMGNMHPNVDPGLTKFCKY
jgi:hypothetical protein